MPMIYKIVCIGPQKTGKTSICNYLANNGFDLFGDYEETDIRIVEFPVTVVDHRGRQVSIDIRLWDCGGAPENDNFWPSFDYDACGVLFVTAPNPSPKDKERLAKMLQYFYKRRPRSANAVLLVRNAMPGDKPSARFGDEDDMLGSALRAAPPDDRIKIILGDLQTKPVDIRSHFEALITEICQSGYKGQNIPKEIQERTARRAAERERLRQAEEGNE